MSDVSTNWIYGLRLLGFYFAYKAYLLINAKAYLLINAGEVRQRPHEDHNGHYVDDQGPLTKSKNPGSFLSSWLDRSSASLYFVSPTLCMSGCIGKNQ